MAESNTTAAPVQSTPGASPTTKAPSAFNASVFRTLDYKQPVYVEKLASAKSAAALAGLQTIIALLHQRELDAESGNSEDGLTFTHDVAIGLLCAAASCADTVEDILEGNHTDTHAFAAAGDRVMNKAIEDAELADARQIAAFSRPAR